MSDRGIRAVGDRACLIELPDLGNVLRVAERLRRLAARGVLPGLVDVVPAARTVLVVGENRAAVRRAIAEAPGIVAAAVDGADEEPCAEEATGAGGGPLRDRAMPERQVVVKTVYDGADLDAVAEYTGLSREAVVAAHTATAWRAAFGGFAPGFVYLAGGDPRLRVPRLDAPRPSVPAGSVAIAGEFSAVYPGASPGGWRLLGRTAARIWDPAGELPALIAPGASVRFRAVRDRVVSAHPAPEATSDRPICPRDLTVVEPGLLSLVQDLGRAGHAAIGVTGSGAMDRGALARANRAVGNPPGSAAIETLAGGLVLRVERAMLAAVAGAAATVRPGPASGDPAGAREAIGFAADTPIPLHPGDTLRVESADRGIRSYVAFRGGLGGEAVLGSRSSDQLSGLGPPPLRAGDGLAVRSAVDGSPAAPDDAPAGSRPSSPSACAGVRRGPGSAHAGPVSLRFVPGPRDDWFEPVALAALGGAEWTVTPRSNRVGARLEGPGLPRARTGELLSEGVVAGAIQVPPDGHPVLFLADHPVTGGYPVIGTVIGDDLDLAGQLAPGDAVRFEAVDPDGAPQRRCRRRAEPAALEPVTAFSIEVDGRRRGLRIPPELAAIMAGLLESPDEAPLREAIAALVAAIERDEAGCSGDAGGGANR
ncbi:carboxyltransferase domain-containing protein [Leucobacter zeae]|nr:carboxyltransferase domain-containing protein [Leucobacter zeae]